MPQICCFYIHSYSTYKHIFTSIEQLWDIWLKQASEAGVGICSSPGSLTAWNALSYILNVSAHAAWSVGCCPFGSQPLLCAAERRWIPGRKVTQSASGAKWALVWSVAVVTVVWALTGSALGPVEWLKALNKHSMVLSVFLCEKRDLIFLWTWLPERCVWHSWTLLLPFLFF